MGRVHSELDWMFNKHDDTVVKVLAVGLVVDDSIIMLENISRHKFHGKKMQILLLKKLQVR